MSWKNIRQPRGKPPKRYCYKFQLTRSYRGRPRRYFDRLERYYERLVRAEGRAACRALDAC
jgi:hypothetical protein